MVFNEMQKRLENLLKHKTYPKSTFFDLNWIVHFPITNIVLTGNFIWFVIYLYGYI